jgi:hypothetical protein
MENQIIKNARAELSQYIGKPMCQDCRWKLGTDITNHCSCMGNNVDPEKHRIAFNRARQLQRIISEVQ